MECLNQIIGLSRKNCECFVDDRPADYNVSKSELYLDELEGLSVRGIDTAIDCGDESPWDMMETAIANAKLRFRTDLLTSIKSRFKDRFAEFDGVIGQRIFNDALPTNVLNPLLGIKVKSNCIKGSVMILKAIDAYFDTDLVDLPVKIYRTDSDIPFAEFTIDATANVKHHNALDPQIQMPLHIDGYEEFAYYIVYDLPLGVKPLNNKLQGCAPCSGKEKWRQLNPWYQYIEMGGISTALFTSTSLLELVGTNSYAYGLNLHAKITCTKSSIICDENDTMDFVNDEVAMHIAYAIRLAAGVSLFNLILQRPDSAFVAINEEQINYLIGAYQDDYAKRMQYIATNIVPNNDCLICDQNMSMGTILA